MRFKEWIGMPPEMRGASLDNRNEPPMDVLEEHYHPKYDTVSCPHCGCTLASHAVTAYHYCYVCGGRFGKKETVCSKCDYNGTSRCDCGDGKRTPKAFTCNDCAYCMANCHDLEMACEDESGKCDLFELWDVGWRLWK